MRILCALPKYDYGIPTRGASGAEAVVEAFSEIGNETIVFWLEENGFPNDLSGLQRRIRQFAEETGPDIVFMTLMNDEIRLETLRSLSEKYITVNWFCDDQYRFFSYSQFVAPNLNCSITVDKYSISLYKDIGCNVVHSQWAAHRFIKDLNMNDIEYKYDVSFIGGRNATRNWCIAMLRNSGIQVECFGDGWPNGRVRLAEMHEIMYHSRINLNLSNSIPDVRGFWRFLFGELIRSLCGKNTRSYGSYKRSVRKALGGIKEAFISKKRNESIKARNFEIPAAGGFELSRYALEIEDYFILGQEIAVFSTMEELKRQISYYLINEEERNTICRAGYKRSRLHTYTERFREILPEILSCAKRQ